MAWLRSRDVADHGSSARGHHTWQHDQPHWRIGTCVYGAKDVITNPKDGVTPTSSPPTVILNPQSAAILEARNLNFPVLITAAQDFIGGPSAPIYGQGGGYGATAQWFDPVAPVSVVAQEAVPIWISSYHIVEAVTKASTTQMELSSVLANVNRVFSDPNVPAAGLETLTSPSRELRRMRRQWFRRSQPRAFSRRFQQSSSPTVLAAALFSAQSPETPGEGHTPTPRGQGRLADATAEGSLGTRPRLEQIGSAGNRRREAGDAYDWSIQRHPAHRPLEGSRAEREHPSILCRQPVTHPI